MRAPVNCALPFHGLWSIDELAAADLLGLLHEAARLKHQWRAGRADKPLGGKNLALLNHASANKEFILLCRAASELGARVAHVPLGEQFLADENRPRNFVQMLGRLYDAVDCGTILPASMDYIKQNSSVPTYNGLARDAHPLTVLADLMCIYEEADQSMTKHVIGFLGDPSASYGRTFSEATLLLGMEVTLAASSEVEWRQDPPDAGRQLLQRSRAHGAASAIFHVDAADERHTAVYAPSGKIDDVERSLNHRFLIQTVLLDTLTA